MAFSENLNKIQCRIAVQIGQTATGGVKTANVNLPTISKTGYTADAFGAICELMDNVLANSAYKYEAVKTYSIEED